MSVAPLRSVKSFAREERAVAETVAEPIERVRLGTETVQDEESVSAEVRKEHIETEGDIDPR